MRINKLGHCCLRIETSGVTFLTDPGHYSLANNAQEGIDFLFYTHEHPDHFHLDSLKKLLQLNPNLKIITNKGVAKLLDAENLPYELLEYGGRVDFGGVKVEGFGEWHAEIYPTIPKVPNTGYLFEDKLFYPGDEFTDPGKEVSVLALPTVGPWLTIGMACDYLNKIKPKSVFPVHDGNVAFPGGVANKLPASICEQMGAKFIVPEIDQYFEV